MGKLYLKAISGHSGGPVYIFIRFLLFAVSAAYRVLIALRGGFVRIGLIPVKKLPVPVISVGNLTLGGTGKTPCVEFLAKELSSRNLRTAIFSRGYGRHPVLNMDDEALQFNDDNVKRFIHKSKHKIYDGIAHSFKPDVVILDDGFQHLRLNRDLDIVLIDATGPFSNGRLFPAGLLREPLRSLGRADMIILTHTDQTSRSRIDHVKDRIFEFNPVVPVLEAIHQVEALKEIRSGRYHDLSALSEHTFLGFCGIGNPVSFRKTLHKICVKVEKFVPFADHHYYSANDYRMLNLVAREFMCGAFITTTKDESRLDAALFDFPVFSTVISFRITEGARILEGRINRLLADYSRMAGERILRQG